MFSKKVFSSVQLLYSSLKDLGVYGNPIVLERNDRDDLVDLAGRVIDQEVLLHILSAFNIRIGDGCKVGRLFIDSICELEYEVVSRFARYSSLCENGYYDIKFENISNILSLKVGNGSVGSYLFCYPKVAEAAIAVRNAINSESKLRTFDGTCCYTVEPFSVDPVISGISVSKRLLCGNDSFTVRSWENKKVDDCVAFLLYVMASLKDSKYIKNVVIFDGEIEFYQPIYHKSGSCTMLFYGR